MANKGTAGESTHAIMVPKILFEKKEYGNLSTDAKIIYSLIREKYYQAEKDRNFDEQGHPYAEMRAEDVMRFLNCNSAKASKIFKDLEDYGLIVRKRRPRFAARLYVQKNI